MPRLSVVALALLAAQAPPPSTDIYLLDLKAGLGSLTQATPMAIAVEKGYDNQPFFTADGRAILFTANRDGKQTDIYEHAIGGATRPITTTPESEYSPTIAPDDGISVIRVEADGTQRLWRFDRDGKNPRLLLENVKPVGYHAWIDNGHFALFVLGPPSTLEWREIYDVAPHRLGVVSRIAVAPDGKAIAIVVAGG